LAILKQRYIFFQQDTEYGATAYLADLVRPLQKTITKKSTRYKPWLINNFEMCDDYFRCVFGISKDKLKGVRALLEDNYGGSVAPGRLNPIRPRVKYNQCKAFWIELFKTCQRPNDHTRLFPVNYSYAAIYDDFFVPWCKKTLVTGAGVPCLGWLMSARHDSDFDDVADRPKHHHCRCLQCANLQARRLQAFNSPLEKEQYMLEWQDHQDEKRRWREFEQGKIMSARHNGAEELVLCYDDTEALGLPKFTKRPHKNLTTSRLQLVPFLISDLAREKDFYIYTAKARFKKGANRDVLNFTSPSEHHGDPQNPPDSLAFSP
jgi:hypothetical protein